MELKEKIRRFNEKYYIINDTSDIFIDEYKKISEELKSIGLNFSTHEYSNKELTIDEDGRLELIYSYNFKKLDKTGLELSYVAGVFNNSEVKFVSECHNYTFGKVKCQVKVKDGVKTYVLDDVEISEDMLNCLNEVAKNHVKEVTVEDSNDDSDDDFDE